MKIIAITVTYNSVNFLERCLNSLNNQSFALDKIIVVDNNSSKSVQPDIKNLVSKFENVTLYSLESNTGGAGGFQFGMSKALEENPDWIWIMDDDAYPRKDCLEKLVYFTSKSNVACVCPLIYGDTLNKYQIYHHKKITKFLMKDVPMYKSFSDIPDSFEIDSNAFVGPLVSAEVVKKIGIVDGSLFIYGDDTEFTYRLTRAGYKMVVIKNAVINHRDVEAPKNEINPKSWWKDYYMYRNRFFFIKEFSKNCFQYFFAKMHQKNIIYMRMLMALIKRKYRGYRMIKISIYRKAIKDAKLGIKGIVIDPAVYIQKINDRKK